MFLESRVTLLGFYSGCRSSDSSVSRSCIGIQQMSSSEVVLTSRRSIRDVLDLFCYYFDIVKWAETHFCESDRGSLLSSWQNQNVINTTPCSSGCKHKINLNFSLKFESAEEPEVKAMIIESGGCWHSYYIRICSDVNQTSLYLGSFGCAQWQLESKKIFWKPK